MTALSARIMLLWGWKRWLLAATSGAVSVLAMPPYSFPLVLLVSMPVLVWLLDGALDSTRGSRRARIAMPAFATGWWFGFGYFLAGLFWIGEAFLVEADLFGWMMPFAIVILPACLAVFHGAAALLARVLWSEGGLRIFALALGFGLLEWARGHFLGGFPWNPLGHAMTVHAWPMQMASVLGVYGLTLPVVVIASAPALLGDDRPGYGFCLFAFVLLVCGVAFGGWRLNGAGEISSSGLRARLVQPNIPQSEKWQPENRARIFSDYLALSRGGDDVDVVIWPESATPFFLADEAGALGSIAETLPYGRYLITGSNSVEQAGRGERPVFRNSVYLIDDAGVVGGRYDKVRLVPFGEFLPLERALEAIGLRRLVTLPGTFESGRQIAPLQATGLKAFQALVCYEIIFSGDVVGEERPDWIVNITNDAWFGTSAGPLQHFHHARLRAVEEGLPVARVANTGISAVIDPYGRLVSHIDYGLRASRDVDIPEPIPGTLFGRYGNIIFFALLGVCQLFTLVGVIRHRTRTADQ